MGETCSATEQERRERNWFDPKSACLQLALCLPPTDNMLHRSGAYGRYPTAGYKDFLGICTPQLDEVLGDWEPDTERWWEVKIGLFLGSRADGPNYTKALLDLLSGARVAEEKLEIGERKIGKGSIYHHGGLWNDDRRVCLLEVIVLEVRVKEPSALMRVEPAAHLPAGLKQKRTLGRP